jgi:hypothetical protein
MIELNVTFTQATINTTASATMFTVIWNITNFRIFSNTLLPHITDFTIDEKLSSSMMISDASFATCVPEIPIAIPTFASFNAGPSFVPSVHFRFTEVNVYLRLLQQSHPKTLISEQVEIYQLEKISPKFEVLEEFYQPLHQTFHEIACLP